MNKHIELLVFGGMGKGQIKTFKRATSTFTLHKPKEKGKQVEVRMGEQEEQSLCPSPFTKCRLCVRQSAGKRVARGGG